MILVQSPNIRRHSVFSNYNQINYIVKEKLVVNNESGGVINVIIVITSKET